MKKCLFCGTELKDDSLFCTECGKPVLQGNNCPHCGASVNDEDVFCQNCGKRIIGEAVPNSAMSSDDTETNSDYAYDVKTGGNILPHKNTKRILYFLFVLLIIGSAWFGYKYFMERDYPSKEIEADLELAHLTERKEMNEDAKNVDDAVLTDTKIIEDWYSFVLGVMGRGPSDKDLDKYLSPNLKKRIWTEDYEGRYEYYRFRTAAQDSSPNGDVSKIESITSEGDGWYIVKYLDMGWEGLTKVKVKDGVFVDLVEDESWKSWDN